MESGGVVAQLGQPMVSLNGWHLIVIAIIVVIFLYKFGVFGEGAKGGNAAFGSAGSSGVQEQELDGANMGPGSTAERNIFASVPRKFLRGDPMKHEDADEYMRWCGVSAGNMGNYKSTGKAAMNNPHAWMMDSTYDGASPMDIGADGASGSEGFTPTSVLDQARKGMI